MNNQITFVPPEVAISPAPSLFPKKTETSLSFEMHGFNERR
jgi:hypothetical protein